MSTKQGRSRTFSLMWASFILFSSDKHHLSNAGHWEISNISSLVSCCMLSGKDSMPLQLLMQSFFREVRCPKISCRLLRLSHHEMLNCSRQTRSPTHCGSAVILWQYRTSSDWREVRCLATSCNTSNQIRTASISEELWGVPTTLVVVPDRPNALAGFGGRRGPGWSLVSW